MDYKDITVCIVDDDDSVRKALKRLIRCAGYQAKSFSSAKEFIGSMYYKNAALLILDVRMPTMSGLALQKYLIDSGIDMPIIFITSFDLDESRQQAKQAGAIGYLQKPVDENALLDTIQRAVSSYSVSKTTINKQKETI